jgi:DNA-directed RNA polymerase subunit RPC12/RpoP
VGERIRGYYKTTCPDCRGEADIVCVFWVKVARCGNPACGQDVPLFRRFMLANHRERKRKNAPLGSFTVLCPTCEEVFQTKTIKEEISCPACGVELVRGRERMALHPAFPTSRWRMNETANGKRYLRVGGLGS